jgi:hypothetical protein
MTPAVVSQSASMMAGIAAVAIPARTARAVATRFATETLEAGRGAAIGALRARS